MAREARGIEVTLVEPKDIQLPVVFPSPLMSTIGELGSFLAREESAAEATEPTALPADLIKKLPSTAPNGKGSSG
ncbi:hypothetical protein [Streptomyces angustmyceticus]|uniref:hypothetical protein n=1 Tax=Streptomyces angustmyceticus TaxID=285578 RepID=UPI00344B7150